MKFVIHIIKFTVIALTVCFSRTASANNQHENTMKEATQKIEEITESVKFTEKNLRNFWKKVNKDGLLPDQSNPHYKGLEKCWVWIACKNGYGYGSFFVSGILHGAHRVSWMIHKGDIPDKLNVLHKCDVPSCVNPHHLFLGTKSDNAYDMEAKGRSRRPSGDMHFSRSRPDLLARGDRNGARLHPDRLSRGKDHSEIMLRVAAKGDRNGSRLHPDRLARGDSHGSKTHPEKTLRGESVALSKLTEKSVLEIRLRYASGGITHRQLSVEYGVSRPLISQIIRRETWKHI